MESVFSKQPEVVAELRAQLGALQGVQSVLLDCERGDVWLMCEPAADLAAVEDGAERVVSALGLGALKLAVLLSEGTRALQRRRIRFVGLERSSPDQRSVRIKVTLQWRDREFVGEAAGEEGAVIELRTAATAALHALDEIIDSGSRLTLIGAKRFRAFDVDLTVVAVSMEGHSFVGSVQFADPLAGAVTGVLNALNRVLGNYLTTTD